MRPRTLALFSCLILLTIALGAVSLGFSTSLQGVFPSRANITPTTTQQHGNLLVRASYVWGTPVSNASVVLRDLASRTLFPLQDHTNASGELLLSESPGQYGVVVSNDEFQASATLGVSNGNTTLLDISVNRTIRATAFNELRATGPAGVAPPWEEVVVAIPANTVLYHSGDTVFLQRYLSQGPGAGPGFVISFPGQNGSTIILNQNGSPILFTYGNLPYNPEIKANVVYSDLRVENQTSLLWLNLTIDKFLSLDLSPGLQLVTYSATTQVPTFAD